MIFNTVNLWASTIYLKVSVMICFFFNTSFEPGWALLKWPIIYWSCDSISIQAFCDVPAQCKIILCTDWHVPSCSIMFHCISLMTVFSFFEGEFLTKNVTVIDLEGCDQIWVYEFAHIWIYLVEIENISLSKRQLFHLKATQKTGMKRRERTVKQRERTLFCANGRLKNTHRLSSNNKVGTSWSSILWFCGCDVASAYYKFWIILTSATVARVVLVWFWIGAVAPDGVAAAF